MRKGIVFMLALIMLVSTLAGCARKPEKLPENARILYIFEVDGTTYTVRTGAHLFLEKVCICTSGTSKGLGEVHQRLFS